MVACRTRNRAVASGALRRARSDAVRGVEEMDGLNHRYLLDRVRAAAYLSISPRNFDAKIAEGKFPKGDMLGGKLLWRRSDLERAADAILGLQPTEAEMIERARHAARKMVNGR